MKQLSIFIENKSGTLIRVLDILSRAGIQIIASTVADTKDFGIYRVLCDKPEQAFIMLNESGINVQLTHVYAISIDDEPGRAANAVNMLSQAGISLLYLYSFLWKGRGVLVFRAEPSELVEQVVKANSLTVLDEGEFA